MARGAKSLLRTLKSSLTPSPEASRPKGAKSTAPPPAVPVTYDEVMAAVDDALQRSAGNSPVKLHSGRGGSSRVGSARDGSARGYSSARSGVAVAGPSRQPWRG